MTRIKTASILMLVFALPMAVFSLVMFIPAIRAEGPQCLGCLGMAFLYVFSVATGILGLVFAKKPQKRIPRVFGWIQLVLALLNVSLLREYALFLLPVLLIETVVFLPKAKRKRARFDPDTQEAVIRCSICTGEQAAGFRDKATGHFTEVMLIKSPDDEKKFMRAYGVTDVKKEY